MSKISKSQVKIFIECLLFPLKKRLRAVEKKIQTSIHNELPGIDSQITHIVALPQSEYDNIPEESLNDRVIYITFDDEEGE